MKRLSGKVALITGGTTGIGLATAKLFRAEGATVLVTGRNPATLEAARAELGDDIEVLASDSGNAADVAKLFADIGAKHGRLDVLFLNAAIVPNGLIATMTPEDFDEAFRINVRGPWLAIKYATPLLSDGAAVVLTGSISGHLGMAGSSAYGATKAALRSLGRTAATELAPRGVRVNTLSPGPTASGVIEKGRGEAEVATIKSRLEGRILMKRLGHVDELARAALFLASADSSFMTGEEIVVDGGMTRV